MESPKWKFPKNEHEKVIRGLQQRIAANISAREDYLNAIEYGYELDECRESHLAGDCPLCGAK